MRKPGSIVSSNTSTIPLGQLAEGAPDGLAPDFMVTHFFNPPRYMQLLGDRARADHSPRGRRTRSRPSPTCSLGKAVVRCNDTPGFVANRLGVYWIATAIGEALARGLTVEEADLLMGEAIGAPRTGVFGLMDLVGLGLHEHVTASLDRLLPAGDAWHDVPAHVDLFRRMVAMGATGRAAGKGFYARDGAQRLRHRPGDARIPAGRQAPAGRGRRRPQGRPAGAGGNRRIDTATTPRRCSPRCSTTRPRWCPR